MFDLKLELNIPALKSKLHSVDFRHLIAVWFPSSLDVRHFQKSELPKIRISDKFGFQEFRFQTFILRNSNTGFVHNPLMKKKQKAVNKADNYKL